jgi:asparagine synthase (glutamine-hydrolysing)
MCGIAGKASTGAPVDPALLDRMCAALEHRGPDAQGTWVDGPVALGMRRLAIIDLQHGEQPFHGEDGATTLVFNGEIYNHEPLRAELQSRGHRFASRSDGEVIVHLWEELGPRCVERLRGMFAFAIWDAGRGELFLARDRIGKKPLFYAPRADALTFGSEPRAVLQDPDVPRDPDPAALDAFLVNQYVPHDRCAFRALRKLPPACTLRWRPGGEPLVERYWRLEYTPKRRMARAEAVERLREEILEATRLRLMSDVPLGAFLSGGVDSSVVVAAMAHMSSEPVKTFSAAFPGTIVDEGPHARAVAERYGTDHHELVIEPPEPALLPRIAWHFGEPFADPAALPTFQLSELVRSRVTVALNGDGGDESFAGYDRYGQLIFTRPAERLPLGLRRALARAARRLAGGDEGRAPAPRAARLARRLTLDPARRYADLFRFLSNAQRDRLYTPDFKAAIAGSDPLEHVAGAWEARAGLDWTDRLMATDLDTYLADDLVAKVDVMSMAHSIEVRSPLLDTELMAFAATLAPEYKAHRGERKLLLREAARAWLPDGILDRPKQGFAVPLKQWLRAELASAPEELLLDPVARGRGLLEPAAVEALIAEHRAGTDQAQALWALMMLELWFRTCVDVASPTPADLPTLA